MFKIYTYKKCSTCRKATQFLVAKGIAYEEHPIRETPPAPSELARMLAAYDGKMTRLFNTSSQDYRDAGLKDTLPDLSEEAAFACLQGQPMGSGQPANGVSPIFHVFTGQPMGSVQFSMFLQGH